jgi:hypothetical protein
MSETICVQSWQLDSGPPDDVSERTCGPLTTTVRVARSSRPPGSPAGGLCPLGVAER